MKNKLVIIKRSLILGLMLSVLFEMYLGWIVLKPNTFELKINSSNREFISNYFEDVDDIASVAYYQPLHHDEYLVTYLNNSSKEILNDDWAELKTYIINNGKSKLFIYYLLYILFFIVIIILLTLTIIVGGKTNRIDKILKQD